MVSMQFDLSMERKEKQVAKEDVTRLQSELVEAKEAKKVVKAFIKKLQTTGQGNHKGAQDGQR